MDDEAACIAFNQDATHIALGRRRGAWQVFACSPFAPCASGDGSAGSITMLFSSSLIALCGCGDRAGDSPRRLRLWNTSTAAPVFELPFASDVVGVHMNRSRLLVVLFQATHIFELATMRMLHTLESSSNELGIAALSWDQESSVCATLSASSDVGRVLLFDAGKLRAIHEVHAHNSAIAAMALSARGDLLATASTKGTVIRVHCIHNGQLLHSLRRGAMRATVYSLAFSTATSAGETGASHELSSTTAPRSGSQPVDLGSRNSLLCERSICLQICKEVVHSLQHQVHGGAHGADGEIAHSIDIPTNGPWPLWSLVPRPSP